MILKLSIKKEQKLLQTSCRESVVIINIIELKKPPYISQILKHKNAVPKAMTLTNIKKESNNNVMEETGSDDNEHEGTNDNVMVTDETGLQNGEEIQNNNDDNNNARENKRLSSYAINLSLVCWAQQFGLLRAAI